MPSQKEVREGKLLKGVPLPPNIPHTCKREKSSHALSKEARKGKLLKRVPLPPNIPHTCTS